MSPAGSPVSEVAFEKPSLPSAADWSEFLSASTSEKVENELAQLTLSDHEQRELYEAARLVQTAFRKYKVKEERASWPPFLVVCGLIKCLLEDVMLRCIIIVITFRSFSQMQPVGWLSSTSCW